MCSVVCFVVVRAVPPAIERDVVAVSAPVVTLPPKYPEPLTDTVVNGVDVPTPKFVPVYTSEVPLVMRVPSK